MNGGRRLPARPSRRAVEHGLYVAQGGRFNFAANWSAGASVAVPLWQDIRASHPDNRYRLMLSLGRAF
jgi:hypothetical protein